MAGESLFFWLGASAEEAETGSSSLRSPEPLRVSAHAGNDPARGGPLDRCYNCGFYHAEHDYIRNAYVCVTGEGTFA
jgi:hypothetical protein